MPAQTVKTEHISLAYSPACSVQVLQPNLSHQKSTLKMSFTSSRGSTPSTSPSQPIMIGSSKSGASYSASRPNPFSSTSTYQPFNSSMRRPSSERPSAYVSDEDLFGADTCQYLKNAPPPPRPVEAWCARPLLPPLKSRRSSSTTQHKSKKDATKK